MKKGAVYLGQALLLGNLAVTFSLIGYRFSTDLAPPEKEATPSLEASHSPAAVSTPSVTTPVLEITARDASKHLLAQDAMFVDVRSLEEFKEGSIPTAYCLPPEREMTEYDRKRLKERPLLIVYGPAEVSHAMAEKLAAQSFKVGVLRGGLEEWRQAGMPVIQAKSPEQKPGT
jgi:rhodanese-related sulfurtransferase